MPNKKFALLCFIVTVVFTLSYSCSKETKTQKAALNLPESPYNYSFSDADEATLGRVLFYDKNLSLNGQTSCASCHKQGLAFSDNKQFSVGFHGDKTTRNTPPIQNISSSGQALFWDGRERDLTRMAVQPIFHHMEMGVFDEKLLVQKINTQPYYQELFEKAYGTSAVDINSIGSALASFIAAIRSDRSQFDQSTFTQLSPTGTMGNLAADGQSLFFTTYNCGSCHNLFSPRGYNGGFQETNSELVNIGLDEEYTDKGLGARTKKAEDNGRFKIPNLRNVALTAPYMHDGRFSTLEEVIDHYDDGVKDNPNLDLRLQDASGKPMELRISDYEKKAIIAFLHTLTDYQLVNDVRFSDPFQYQ